MLRGILTVMPRGFLLLLHSISGHVCASGQSRFIVPGAPRLPVDPSPWEGFPWYHTGWPGMTPCLLWLFSEPSRVAWSSQGSLLGQRGLTRWVPLRPRDQCLSEGADGSRERTKSCCAGLACSPWDSRNMSYIRQMSWELAGDLLAGTST